MESLCKHKPLSTIFPCISNKLIIDYFSIKDVIETFNIILFTMIETLQTYRVPSSNC